MKLIFLVISIFHPLSFLLAATDPNSCKDNLVKSHSFSVSKKTKGNFFRIFSKKLSNLDLKKDFSTNPSSSTKMEKAWENVRNFERIYSKWGKRPADLNCAWAPKVPRDRRRNTRLLRIMSYNAEWLFLYGGSGSIQCPGIGCSWKNLAEAKRHVMQTVDLLIRIDPDIVHLNEIEDCRILRVIMDLLPKNHGYRAYLVRGTDNTTGQNVGILTRVDPISDLQRTENRTSYPIIESKCGNFFHKSRISGTMGLSKHYLTRFEIGEMKILWAGAHLIAHPNNIERCYRREAQATVLSDFIEKFLSESETEIIITGDFNDHDDEVSGANNTNPLSSVLRILKNGRQKLQSAASFVVDPFNRYTSWHDINGNCVDDGQKEHSLIDHVLITPGLKSRVTSVWMDHNNTISCHERASDHWPIIVDIVT